MPADTALDAQRLAETVPHFLRGLLSAYAAADVASISVTGTDEGDTIIHVQPCNPQAATMEFNVRNGFDVIYCWIGKNTPLELTARGERYSSLKGFEEFRSLVDAVIRGRFLEILWRNDDRIVRSSGVINFGGRDTHIHHSTIWRNPFAHGTKEELKYMPY